jgi:putative ABC transport system permease protein
MFFKALRNRTPLGFLQLKYDKARLITAIAGISFADMLIFMQLGLYTISDKLCYSPIGGSS